MSILSRYFALFFLRLGLKGVRGLDSRQIELARVDAATTFPAFTTDPIGAEPLESLARALESLRARVAGKSVPATDVSSYHTLLDLLDSEGIDTQCARIATSELVRPVTTPTSEQWVDTALFRRRLSSVLSVLRRP